MKDKIRAVLDKHIRLYHSITNRENAVDEVLALFAELEKDRARLNYLCNNTISIVISGATVTSGTYIDRDIIDRAMNAEADRKEATNK